MAARTLTRLELRTRLDSLCDIENDAHISTAEKNLIINSAMAETWDLIIAAGLAEQYVKSVNFSTVSGTLEYDLASSGIVTDTDFYKVSKLYVVEQTYYLRPLKRLSPSQIYTMRPPLSVVSMRLKYIPTAPVYGTGDDASTFDGINGWEEHTLMTACCAVKMKKEESYDLFYKRKMELVARIKTMGNTDYGEPPRVAVRSRAQADPFMNFTSGVNAYVIRGKKLELYYSPEIMP